jgi:hypothetical protein
MFERRVPGQRWRASAWLALALLVAGVGVWELKMRSLGLRTADIDDGKSYWAVERRKVDTGPRDQVVIVGDSRILFDTNLDEWRRVSGIQPLQLAIAGTSAVPVLQDLADDEHFAGLVVLGIVDAGPDLPIGLARSTAYTKYPGTESPSQRFGQRIGVLLQRRFAFLDSSLTLFGFFADLPFQERAGVVKFFFAGAETWKLGEVFENRQTAMWSRIEQDPNLQAYWRGLWSGLFKTRMGTQAIPQSLIQAQIERLVPSIEKIRNRGGAVVLIRPPSADPLRAIERTAIPRQQGWDALVRDSRSVSIHFEDYPEMQGLNLVEYSHLSADSAKKFTRAYVNVLCDKVPWLRQHGATCNGYPDEP